MVASRQERAAEAAAELMKSMTRLRARLRSETAPTEMSATWSQLTTLARIIAEGPTTTSALAQAEHVRRQSMAETIAALRALGVDVPVPDELGRPLLYGGGRVVGEVRISLPF